MRGALALAFVLAGSAAGWAGPLFVAVDGDDATGDGTQANPFATVQAGIDAAADGDTVYVKAGVYADEPHGHLRFDDGEDGEFITVAGYYEMPGDGDRDAVVIRPSGAGLRVLGGMATGTIEMRHLTLTCAGAFNVVEASIWPNVHLTDVSLRFVECRLQKTSDPAGETRHLLWLGPHTGADAPQRTILLQDCELDAGSGGPATLIRASHTAELRLAGCVFSGAAGHVLALQGRHATVTVEDCVGTVNYCFVQCYDTLTQLRQLRVRGNDIEAGLCGVQVRTRDVDVRQVEVVDNRLVTNGYGVVIGSSNGELGMPRQVYGVRIHNNVLKRVGENEGHVILVGQNCAAPVITSNFVHGLEHKDFGIVTKAPRAFVAHNVCVGSTPLYVANGWATRVVHNTTRATNGPGLMVNLGRNACCSHASGTLATTDGGAWVQLEGGADLSRVVVDGTLDLPGRTDGVDGTSIFDIEAVDDIGDRLKVAPVPGPGSTSDWSCWGQRPRFLVATDNVFDSREANYVALAILEPMHMDAVIDRNCYYSGDTAVVHFKDRNFASLVAARQTWSSWAGAADSNDRESFVADPLFVNAAEHDFQLSAGSPCLGGEDDECRAIGAMQWAPPDNMLPALGACCAGELCLERTQAACMADGGVYLGDATCCAWQPCGPSAAGGVFLSEIALTEHRRNGTAVALELQGQPLAPLAGLHIVLLAGPTATTSTPGTVLALYALDGRQLGSNGVALLRNPQAPAPMPAVADGTTVIDAVFSAVAPDGTTYVLAEGTPGCTVGDDLDADDDGVLDAGLPGLTPRDAVGAYSDGNAGFAYAPQLLGEAFAVPAAAAPFGLYRMRACEQHEPYAWVGGALVEDAAMPGAYHWDPAVQFGWGAVGIDAPDLHLLDLGVRNAEFCQPPRCAGDTDCSGQIDFDDITLFVTSIGDDGTAWRDHFALVFGHLPPCGFLNGDCDGDGDVDFDDITPFVNAMGRVCR